MYKTKISQSFHSLEMTDSTSATARLTDGLEIKHYRLALAASRLVNLLSNY